MSVLANLVALTSTMTRCLKEGRLVESGTHQELMERKGEYYDLYSVQAQAYA